MSVNRVNESTGELVTLSSGVRCWIGTKAAHTIAVANHTIPNNVMVCITDDWKNKDDYSTEETDTGKHWIDGKPIYRKVYPVTITEPTTVTEIIVPLDDTLNKNNAKLISYGGYLEPGTSGDSYIKGVPYIFRTGGGDNASISCVIGSSSLAMIYSNLNSGNTGYVWVEYVKTTD